MKKYVVETWFRLEEIFDEEEKAIKRMNDLKEQKRYKDTEIIVLTETRHKHGLPDRPLNSERE